MEINLNDKYVITSDTYCYVLNKKMVNKKTKEEYLSAVGYYGDLEHLVDSLINKEIRESEVNSIQGILKVIEKAKNDIVLHLKDMDL